MESARAVRFWCTDRHGPIGADGPRQHRRVTERAASWRPSAEPYASFNLGDHVGDVPDLVAEHRSILSHARLSAGAHPQGDPPPVSFMRQVHGSSVTVLAGPSPEAVPDCDALVTMSAGVPIAVLVADCIPVVLYQPQGEVIAVVHVGRRGVCANIVRSSVAAMVDLGTEATELRAWVGPSIGGCCYEVPAALQDEVCRVVPEARATTRWGTPALDLRHAVRRQLDAAGVRDVRTSAVCTFESADYFSFRRDGVTGRFAAVVEIAAEL